MSIAGPKTDEEYAKLLLLVSPYIRNELPAVAPLQIRHSSGDAEVLPGAAGAADIAASPCPSP